MEQNPPWEADSRPGDQQVQCIYGTRSFISVHKSLPMNPILGQMIPTHTLIYTIFLR
jgi:hypothetical protein